MTLFIANTTKQNWNHHFRVPEMTRAYFVKIPAGSQIKVSENLSIASEEAIIQQLQRYGGRNASDVSGKLEKFPGIFYRHSKPITESEIIAGHDAVMDHAERRSAEEATKSALGFDASNRDKHTGERLVKESEVEIIEQVPRGKKATGKEVKFGLTVSKDGNSKTKLPGV